jgi:hypothetical protein
LGQVFPTPRRNLSACLHIPVLIATPDIQALHMTIGSTSCLKSNDRFREGHSSAIARLALVQISSKAMSHSRCSVNVRPR